MIESNDTAARPTSLSVPDKDKPEQPRKESVAANPHDLTGLDQLDDEEGPAMPSSRMARTAQLGDRE